MKLLAVFTLPWLVASSAPCTNGECEDATSLVQAKTALIAGATRETDGDLQAALSITNEEAGGLMEILGATEKSIALNKQQKPKSRIWQEVGEDHAELVQYTKDLIRDYRKEVMGIFEPSDADKADGDEPDKADKADAEKEDDPTEVRRVIDQVQKWQNVLAGGSEAESGEAESGEAGLLQIDDSEDEDTEEDEELAVALSIMSNEGFFFNDMMQAAEETIQKHIDSEDTEQSKPSLISVGQPNIVTPHYNQQKMQAVMKANKAKFAKNKAKFEKMRAKSKAMFKKGKALFGKGFKKMKSVHKKFQAAASKGQAKMKSATLSLMKSRDSPMMAAKSAAKTKAKAAPKAAPKAAAKTAAKTAAKAAPKAAKGKF